MVFIMGLPKFEEREVILVVVDRLTKYTYFVGLSHPYQGPQVARAYANNMLKLQGLPDSTISNPDVVFLGSFWKELF